VPDTANPLRRIGGVVGDLIRGAFGAGGYERYREHHAIHHPGEAPLDRAAWFRRREHERWEGVSRCC
jgi:uncharacterized short protein YbdD (DUF466 family)